MDNTWWSVSFIPDTEMIVLTLGQEDTKLRVVLSPEEAVSMSEALKEAIQLINLNILKK